MLGLAVALVAVLQVSAVPVWNEAIEVEHSSEVQDDMTRVRSAVLSTAGSGGSGSASVSLGTGYPNRVVLRSPPASTGRLATTPAANLSVGNVTATVGGNAATYWESVDGNLSTRALVYTPRYNEYQRAPETVYENTVVYNRFDDGNGTVTGQTVVDGRRLNLVTLDGRLSRDSSSRFSVETEPVSAPANAVTVTNTSSGNLTVELPGALPVGTWRSLLGDEMTENGGHVVGVNETDRGVVVEMEGGVDYEMRAASVGVGDGAEETEGEYVVGTEKYTAVPEGTNVTLTAEVRDGYNSPVSGEDVGARVVDGGSFAGGGTTAQGVTGISGEVGFRYNVSEGRNLVSAEINGGAEPYENATFKIEGWSSDSDSDETEFDTLSADAVEQGSSGKISKIEASGEVNNPDTNGVIRVRVRDDSDNIINENSNGMTASGAFSFPTDVGERGPVTVEVDILDGADNPYQECTATGVEGGDSLSLSDFSCS